MKCNPCVGTGAIGVLAFSVLCASWRGVTGDAIGKRAHPIEFEELSLHIEVDLEFPRDGRDRAVPALDFPAEVVLEASSKRCFAALRMKNASGKTVLDVGSPGAKSVAVAEIEIGYEGRLRDVLEEFAPGVYSVQAVGVDGTPVEGVVSLRGGFPGMFTVVSPRPEELLAFGDVTIDWTASLGAARYVLEVEAEDTGFAMEVTLPPTQTSFTIPKSSLEPGAYEYSLAVKGDTDNELEIEGRFLLAPQGPFRRGPTAR